MKYKHISSLGASLVPTGHKCDIGPKRVLQLFFLKIYKLYEIFNLTLLCLEEKNSMIVMNKVKRN